MKSFVIKKDSKNSKLWQTYINWLNLKTHKRKLKWTSEQYYWIDDKWNVWAFFKRELQNKPISIITLEEWNNKYITEKLYNWAKKELPKYFVIKNPWDTELWRKYITWLNKTYGSTWYWNKVDAYYWYTKNFDNVECTEWRFNLRYFDNVVELTLEEWDEIVNWKEIKWTIIFDIKEQIRWEWTNEKECKQIQAQKCIDEFKSLSEICSTIAVRQVLEKHWFLKPDTEITKTMREWQKKNHNQYSSSKSFWNAFFEELNKITK